ncbi:hypothetical protein [Nostoc sp. CHAB 5715]|uniref:hypothetical protein n=1 Tax=Nostoc sp. CHAB 5715 TaxID=2780400 RepID=UPI001E2EBA7E|nr:hypothetical protein [Nostoc sp. CHAB 5715]MCC5625192.1 hypothetical protein [Nostoc sp. CHAB 5715]
MITGDNLQQVFPLVPMPNAQCPMPHAPCPMPNAQCPMPNAQCPMPHFQKSCINHQVRRIVKYFV